MVFMELTINKLRNVLEEAGFKVKEVQKTPQFPHKQLCCLRLKDQLDWSQAFIIRIDTKIYQSPLSEKKMKNHTQKVIEFLFIYPFQVDDHALYETGRYLFLINKTLEDQGFGISEADRAVYYRNRRYISEGLFDVYLFLDFVGANLLMIDSFKEAIEKIANGSMTLTDVLSSERLKIA